MWPRKPNGALDGAQSLAGEEGAIAWENSAGSAGSVEAGGTGGSHGPWPGERGLARCREDKL